MADTSYDFQEALAGAIPANRLSTGHQGRSSVMVASNGAAPSFTIDARDRVIIAHECVLGRMTTEVDTITSFGWFVVELTAEAMRFNRPVRCTLCHHLDTDTFVAEEA